MKVININRNSDGYFQSGWSRVFDSSAKPLSVLRDVESIKTTKHPEDLRFYPFTWGVIIERRLNQSVIWDVCINVVQKITDVVILERVKKHVFVILKSLIPEYTAEPILLNELENKWVVYSGSSYSEITIACNIDNEDAARLWMGEKMIPQCINEVVSSLYIKQNYKKTPLTA
ncbi:MAG: hypothetical protein JKY56_20265 [Kofleriaceae bacterium]|nr:hypothetical protein [Kofleriaceae bacterium]